ncbi:RpiR family transcriptional regulator [Mycolicibacterium litorale]|uniref:RpiR family transcriptional regulator n=1 Tax=Mycolicibacterium litorale TaxID=758802 RepID=A0A6S6P1D1_9MYCO|nr:MurR/RpiR family transcriptional regulator [Mycolicibacterium litorale]BCI51786.1 RpiR family transcriptional regulator [Mycolicibacterium litorale]
MSAAPLDDVTETVRGKYDKLTNSQKRIAETIIEDPEFVAFATVDKLATRLDVAASTVVRFAYKLGLDGYQDLQERIRQQIRNQYRAVGDAEGATTPTSHLAGTSFQDSLDRDLAHLQRTARSLHRDVLAQAVTALADAEHVYITGDLTSYCLAHFTAIAVGRTRERVRLVQADAEGATALLEMGPDDVLLAYTFPPYSRNVLRVVESAVRRRTLTIGVTDAAISPVGQRVSIVLSAVASGIGPQNTLVSGMAVANALVNGLIQRDEAKSIERYKAVGALAADWDLFVLGPDNGS